jgi:uncharacterized repeat protein (TIGR01451 family)
MTRTTRRTTASAFARALIVVAAMLPIAGNAMIARASGTFQTGDVFVGVANGQVQWYHPDGTLNETLDNTVGGYTTGMAFDAAGHLYVTNFSAGENAGSPAHPSVPKGGGTGSVSEFDTNGDFIGFFGDGYNVPESILFDQAGNAYVGNVGGGTLKFDAGGNLLQTFNTGRTDWIDLAADQCTLFYTDESGVIHRYDVCTDAQLSDFASSGGQYALRLLPGGGLIAAASGTVNRFDSSGNITQSYDAPGEDSWFALNLDPDGTSLWSADFSTADFVKFDISSGDVLETFNTGTGSSTVFGLSVFGEITVGSGKKADLSITKTDSPDPLLVDNLLTYTLNVSNGGPDTAKDVVVTDTLPSGVHYESSSTSVGSCSQSGGTVTCDLGDMQVDDSATITIDVTTKKAGTIENLAEVSSSTADPVDSNNSATADTTVNPAPSGGTGTGAGGTAHGSPLLPALLVLGTLVLAGALRVRRAQKN